MVVKQQVLFIQNEAVTVSRNNNCHNLQFSSAECKYVSLSDVVSTTSGPQKFASGSEGSRAWYVLQQIPLVNF